MPEEGDKSSWKNIGYLVVLAQNSNGPVMMGRAVGLRSDGRPFVGDYTLAPIWKEDFMWQPHAKKRLDTFLNCACIEHSPCSTHKLYFENWQRADLERINAIVSEPLPEAIEILMRAEMARQQSRIVAPGR